MLSKPVFRMFGDYLKCFNNKMVQGNKTNIMFERILLQKYLNVLDDLSPPSPDK